MTKSINPNQPPNATAVIVLANGDVIWGKGFGAETSAVGEICFNTSMTGYQEILTDPSYAGQIITFTFPHIGNVGTNEEDLETTNPASRGLIVREDITNPSNWRAAQHLDEWLKSYNLPGISGVDTRALTRLIRDSGAPNAVICHSPDGAFDIPALTEEAKNWPGLEGMDLAKEVSCTQSYDWKEKCWVHGEGFPQQDTPAHKIVAVDFGAKRNILRCLANAGCDVTVVPASSTAEDILSHKPDGVFLSNGPGDPAATADYAVPMIKALLESNIPIFGICLGHQLLATALGAKTRKMHLGHRGGNQPVKDLQTGKVEITSQNHGFEVIAESLPKGIEESHVSLFDGSNEGIKVTGRPVFSVQYHPEASPGPQDSYYLFERFVENIKKAKAA
jgi:carbamoyl-phosphate synthase small subunit